MVGAVPQTMIERTGCIVPHVPLVCPESFAMPVMRNLLIPILLGMAASSHGARPYVNDKKVPDNRQDLEFIQKAVIEVLPRIRAATVAINLKEGAGSGVVVSPDGLVLTAAHVSGAVGQEVTLVFEDGTEAKARTLGLDSERDAAMVRITSPERKDWPMVEIDREDSCRLGDWVLSLGHAGGFDKQRGVVLRVGRLVKISDFTLHSDCLLIGGDSGGPLFDLQGKLVGIHSRVGQALQENMHVPMSVYLENWDKMREGEFLGEGPFAKRPVKGSGFLGFASEARAEGGLVVTKVGKDTPAEAAGVKVGDVVLKANDKPLSQRGDLQAILADMAAGERITFEVLRGKETSILTIELGER